MRKLIISIAMLSVLLTTFSCVDSKYHWDNLNKEGVVDIPPVPLGAFKPIVIGDFFKEPLVIKDLPIGKYKGDYVFENLFGDKSIKRFFHDYVERDIILAGKLEMYMLGWDSDLTLDVDFFALDENKKTLSDINIKGNMKVEFGTQQLNIIIPKEDVPLMRQAQHLQMTLTLETPRNITIVEGDYIKLSEMIIKASGYLIDL